MAAKTRIFLDTNVLVYQFDRSDPAKQKRAEELIGQSIQEGTAVISSQVVQEFINIALNKFDTRLSTAELEAVLTDLLKPLCAHFPTLDYYERALKLYTVNSTS